LLDHALWGEELQEKASAEELKIPNSEARRVNVMSHDDVNWRWRGHMGCVERVSRFRTHGRLKWHLEHSA